MYFVLKICEIWLYTVLLELMCDSF